MTEAVRICLPLTVPAVTNPANFVLMKSQTQAACAAGMDFLQGSVHKPLLQGHFWPRGAENPVFLKYTGKGQKLTLTELPNWKRSRLTRQPQLLVLNAPSWEEEWEESGQDCPKQVI